MKKDETPRYTLRVPKELLDKFAYIAAYHGRSKNKELEQMIISRKKAYENKHGPIIISQEIEDLKLKE